MAMVHPDLVKWLTLQIADITGRGGLSRFDLYHTSDESSPEPLHKLAIDENGADPQDIGQSLWDIAENDASNRALGMPQRYVVWAMRGPEGEMDGQWSFSIRGKALMRGHLDMGEPTDPSNERGHVGQMMRHNESIHRMMMLMTDATAGRLAAELQQERARREQVENKMLENIRMHEDLLDRKAERQLAEARETAKARRHDEMMGFFIGMAPLLMSQFMGHKGLAGEASAAMRDGAIGKILKNLSEAETMGIVGALSEQNRFAFMELYKSYAQEDAQREAQKPIPFRDPKSAGGGKK